MVKLAKKIEGNPEPLENLRDCCDIGLIEKVSFLIWICVYKELVSDLRYWFPGKCWRNHIGLHSYSDSVQGYRPLNPSLTLPK